MRLIQFTYSLAPRLAMDDRRPENSWRGARGSAPEPKTDTRSKGASPFTYKLEPGSPQLQTVCSRAFERKIVLRLGRCSKHKLRQSNFDSCDRCQALRWNFLRGKLVMDGQQWERVSSGAESRHNLSRSSRVIEPATRLDTFHLQVATN